MRMCSESLRARLRRAAAASALLAAACAGETVTAPLDEGRCLNGTLATGVPVSGRLTAASCQRWSPRARDVVASESWALEADSNAFYIVRMMPTDTAPGATPLRARLSAYALGATGELQLVGGDFFRYGPAQRNSEMFLPTQTAGRYWIRVEGTVMGDSGAYRVETIRCPIQRLRLDSLSGPLGPVAPCLASSLRNGAPSTVLYAAFDPPAVGSYDVRLRRVSGTASFAGYYLGYGSDVADLFAGAFILGTGPRTDGQFTYQRTLTRRGRVGVLLTVHADSSAAIDVLIANTPALRGLDGF